MNKITPAQFKELEEASKPLQEFFRKHLHPHHVIIYDGDRVIITEEQMAIILPAHTN